MEVRVYSMVIEVTRRCNMSCPHCLRGDAQAVNMPKEYIDSLFSQVDFIETLTISGGEPSLVPEIIHYIIDSAKTHSTEISNFYIVTNAKTVSEEFLTALIRLYAYCSDNEMSGLAISLDQFHDNVPEENVKLLKAFAFTEERGEMGEKSIIEMGRAIVRGLGRRDISCDELIIESYDDQIDVQDAILYLNTKGNIIRGCDFSYEAQDEEEMILCKVDDLAKTLEGMVHQHLE